MEKSVLRIGEKLSDYTIVECLGQSDDNRVSYLANNGKKQKYILKLYDTDKIDKDFLILNDVPESVLYKLQGNKIKRFPMVIEKGEITINGHHYNYLVRKYIDGRPLSELLTEGKTFSYKQATDIICDIAYTLWNYNQITGYIHNDICPDNIIIKGTKNPVGYLIGLGNLAYDRSMPIGIHVSELNRSYMAPETLDGHFSMQSDVFSLGVVLYQMLTGRLPWGDNQAPRLKTRASSQQKTAVMKALELNKSNRYINHIHFIKALYKEKPLDDVEILDLPSDVVETEPDNTSQSPAGTDSSFIFKRNDGSLGGFKDVAGLNELKEKLTDQVLFPLTDKYFQELYGGHALNGMLLYGPPGCGKTFLAEKFAEESGMSYTFVKTSDLASIFVHGSQEKIAALFKEAENHAPCIVCIDEIEGLISNRSNIMQENYAMEVNEFLTQVNNCSERGIFVIGTSNRPDRIDPAMLRKGRFDEIVYVPLPDAEMRKSIFEYRLRNVYSDIVDFVFLASITEGFVASDIESIVNIASLKAAKRRIPVNQGLLEDVIKTFRKSVSSSQMKQYESIRNKMEDDGCIRKSRIGFTI